jgi:transposase-like protein
MKIKAFATEILENPTPFTLNFVQEVLKYNNAPSEFIDDSVNIIKAFQTLNITDNNKILTVEDLNIDVEELTVNGLNCETSQQNSRWILIEGMLPTV